MNASQYVCDGIRSASLKQSKTNKQSLKQLFNQKCVTSVSFFHCQSREYGVYKVLNHTSTDNFCNLRFLKATWLRKVPSLLCYAVTHDATPLSVDATPPTPDQGQKSETEKKMWNWKKKIWNWKKDLILKKKIWNWKKRSETEKKIWNWKKKIETVKK